MLPTLVLNQFSPFDKAPVNFMDPAELRAETVPFTFSNSIEPALDLALIVPSQFCMLIVPAEDSVTSVPFTLFTAIRPARFSRLRSVSAGTDTLMLALGPLEKMYFVHASIGDVLG